MANQNKKPLRFTKRTKRRKKDIYKHLTVQGKRGEKPTKAFPFSREMVFSPRKPSCFSPFFPMPQGILPPLSYLPIFFLLFLLFPKRSVFLFYFPLCHKFIRASVEHFSAQEGNLLFRLRFGRWKSPMGYS